MSGRLIEFPTTSTTPARVKLTPALVKRAEYDHGIDSSWQVLWDTEVTGFGLRLRWNKRTNTTTRTYIVIYRQQGKRRQLTIGDASKVTVAHARDAARKAWAAVELGADPSVEKQERRRAEDVVEHPTLGELFERWLTDYAEPRRKTWKIDRARLLADPDDVKSKDAKAARRNAPIRRLHELRPGELQRDAVEDALRDLHAALTDLGTPGEANKVVATVRTALNWCVRQRLVPAMYTNITQIIDINPAQVRTAHLRPVELEKFADAAATLKRSWRCAVWFMLLTGARSKSEALSLQWSNVNLDVAELVFVDTKNGRDHTLPITPAIATILDTMRGASPTWVFPSRRVDGPMLESRKAFASLREHGGFADRITPHALRHTARTLLQAKCRVPGPTVDAVLNHATGGMAGVYTHVTLDDIAEAMNELAELVLNEAAIEDFAGYLAAKRVRR